MEREVTAASPIHSLLRPWKDEWQLWCYDRKSKAVTLSKCGPLLDLPASFETIGVVPACAVVSVPFLVESPDPAAVRSMAFLELEMRGFASGDRVSGATEIQILSGEGEKALVLGIIYPQDTDLKFIPERAKYLVPSPFVLPVNGTEIQLWREFDDIVASIVWRDQVVCWETLHFTSDQNSIETWLRCLLAQVREELNLVASFSLRQWAPILEKAPDWLEGEFLSQDSVSKDGPSVSDGLPQSGWIPAAIRAKSQIEGKKRTLLQAALAVAGLVAVALSLAAISIHKIGQKEREIDAEIASIDSRLSPIKEVAEEWGRVEQAVVPRLFPIEILHLAVEALPTSGVRLTAFETSPDRILIEGEATNVAGAAEYFKLLEANPSLVDKFDLEMAPSSLQANNTARFVIIGVRK